ncbi:hypothetical protein MBANPS3_010206 [Mucor bainieri]
MPSYLLLTLSFIFVALLASQQVVADANHDACIKRAYHFYDSATKDGDNFNFAIKLLNFNLQQCGDSDSYTLCRIDSGGFFYSCNALSGGNRLTKAECEAEASKDYLFRGADGSRILYKAQNAKCINSYDFDCLSLC